MWGGVSRLKEHLAQKRGDVIACNMCPSNVIIQMQEHLIELSHAKEQKERRRRETLENMRRTEVQDHQPQGPQQEAYTEETDEKERSLLEQAIQESLRTHEIERSRTPVADDDEFEAARQESIRSYLLEKRSRGEGSSTSIAGPSHRYAAFDPETDYDSDLGF